MFTAAALVAACLWSSTAAAQQPDRGEAAAATFERLSKAIAVFGPDDFLFGFRERPLIPRAEQQPLREFAKYLDDHRSTSAEYLSLVTHADARVRTLALIALYDLEDPHFLPAIFRSVQDPAPTFPAMVPRAQFVAADSRLTPDRISPQTVGEIATAILNVYLRSGGFFYGPTGLRGQPGFQEYWQAHAGRQSAVVEPRTHELVLRAKCAATVWRPPRGGR